MKRTLLAAGFALLLSAMIWAHPTETPTPANTPQAGEIVSTPLSKEGSDAAARGDYASALKAFQKAADQGDAAALANLGRLYETGKGVPQDYGKAIELYEQAAAKGYVPAQVSLAAIYASGRGVPLDYKKAALLLEKAATKGDARAKTGLAWHYENGFGVPQDLAKAILLYQEAAEQGYVRAEVTLAHMYSRGRGVSQNKKKAAELFERAANQGDPNAQTNLGWMYHEGMGVPKDYQRAVELFHKAVYQEQSPYAFNDYAWFLATCPEQSQRNGKDAVAYANKACQLSGWKEANFIGTLAAAFAELGDFDAAVRYQKQAMAMESDYPDKQSMEKALRLYQQRKPYRE